MMPNTCNNNPSLSAAKTSTFSGRTFTSHNCPEGLYCSPFAALSLSTEPIWKMFFPISHLDTKTWENRVQVWKIPMLPFKRGNGEKCLSWCSKGISLINHVCKSQQHSGGSGAPASSAFTKIQTQQGGGPLSSWVVLSASFHLCGIICLVINLPRTVAIEWWRNESLTRNELAF